MQKRRERCLFYAFLYIQEIRSKSDELHIKDSVFSFFSFKHIILCGSSMATAMKSGHSKDARPNRQGNAQRMQNALLLWLDSNIDETNSDCRNTLTQPRRAVNTVYTFTDANDCFRFIEELTDNKACVITSGSLGQHVVPCIHHMSQVNSIFIFCENTRRHEQWASEWSKTKGFLKILH